MTDSTTLREIRPELSAYVGDALLGISLGPRLSDEIGDAVRWVMRINATSFRPYEKARADNPGFEKRCSLELVSSSGLAECLGNARLERLYGRKRDLLSQRCKFLGLLGECLELLA